MRAGTDTPPNKIISNRLMEHADGIRSAIDFEFRT